MFPKTGSRYATTCVVLGDLSWGAQAEFSVLGALLSVFFSARVLPTRAFVFLCVFVSVVAIVRCRLCFLHRSCVCLWVVACMFLYVSVRFVLSLWGAFVFLVRVVCNCAYLFVHRCTRLERFCWRVLFLFYAFVVRFLLLAT